MDRALRIAKAEADQARDVAKLGVPSEGPHPSQSSEHSVARCHKQNGKGIRGDSEIVSEINPKRGSGCKDGEGQRDR